MSQKSDFGRISSGETSDYSANSLNFVEYRCSSSSASSLCSVDSSGVVGSNVSSREGRDSHLTTQEILVAADNVYKGMAVRISARCVRVSEGKYYLNSVANQLQV
jgi:hypothetical protein